jgi:hypothetical protein
MDAQGILIRHPPARAAAGFQREAVTALTLTTAAVQEILHRATAGVRLARIRPAVMVPATAPRPEVIVPKIAILPAMVIATPLMKTAQIHTMTVFTHAVALSAATIQSTPAKHAMMEIPSPMMAAVPRALPKLHSPSTLTGRANVPAFRCTAMSVITPVRHSMSATRLQTLPVSTKPTIAPPITTATEDRGTHQTE